jgi:hypothetical protein
LADSQLDVNGLLGLNVALDSLFDFEDGEIDVILPKSEDKEAMASIAKPSVAPQMIKGKGLKPEMLFVA